MVSVIIVVRNAEKNIIACIDSIFCQFKEGELWELIIVDGLSTDKTKEIIIDYLNQRNIEYRIENNPQKLWQVVGIRLSNWRKVNILLDLMRMLNY